MNSDPNLVESLNIGGRAVVSDGDNLGITELHAEGRCHLGQSLDEILGNSAVHWNRNQESARERNSRLNITYLGLCIIAHLLQEMVETWLHFLKALLQSALSSW